MSASGFLAANPGCILVEVAGVRGSAPRMTDAYLIVSVDGVFGTVGGGRLEFDAIDRARRLLAGGGARDMMDVALGPDINQCCGGRVTLRMTRVDDAMRAALAAREAAEVAARKAVLVFGAGHVGRALAVALAPLPFNVTLADARPGALLPPIPGVTARAEAMPEAIVRGAPPGSAAVVLTHDHDLDFLIASEALARGDFAYVGLIGSKTKKAVFRSRFLAGGGTLAQFAKLTSPVGANPTGDKRPEVIAAFVVAELCARLLAPSV